MSPFLLQPSVFSRPPLALQPNFYASDASSFLSIICRLLLALSLEGFSLWSLFRTRVLCFHQVAASFCKIPGVGSPERTCGTLRHANSFASYHIHVSPAASCNYALFRQRRATIPPILNSFHTLSIATGVVWYPCGLGAPISAPSVLRFFRILPSQLEKPHNACPLVTVTVEGWNCRLRAELASCSVLA